MLFKIRPLIVAVAAVSGVSLTHAAGLDRSNQPSSVFTEAGTFAYIEGISINPEVGGKDNAKVATTEANYVAGRDVPNMSSDHFTLHYGAKADINDSISIGAFVDQPWGADVDFEGINNFTGAPTAVISSVYQDLSKTLQASNPAAAPITTANDLNNLITSIQAGQKSLPTLQNQLTQVTTALANPNLPAAMQTQLATQKAQLEAGIKTINAGVASLPSLVNVQQLTNGLASNTESTRVSISSKNYTGLVGIKLGENKNFQIYGGPALQKIQGDLHLRGNAYKQATGYDANVLPSEAVGWMAGVAYTKPEIALKAALTYRSEIEHDADIAENLPLAALRGLNPIQTNEVKVTTPKSVNLDFQTGLNRTTLLTAKARWVPWSEFAIKPKLYGDLSGLNLVSYDEDAWTAEVGLGKKINDKLAISGSVGWDSGAGNPVSSLGPVEGNWNVGLGAKFNLTPEWALSGGAKYIKFGDAKAELPDGSIVGDFQDNDGMVYGLRLSYQKQ